MAKRISKADYEIICRAIPRGEVKKGTPHYGLKEHASVDVKSGLVLATTMTPASVSSPEGGRTARRIHDTNYLPYLTLASCHTPEPVKEVNAERATTGSPIGHSFISMR